MLPPGEPHQQPRISKGFCLGNFFKKIKAFLPGPSVHSVLLANASGGAIPLLTSFFWLPDILSTCHCLLVPPVSAKSHLLRLILLSTEIGLLLFCQIPAAKLVFANPDDSGVQKKDGAPRPRPFALN